jgi:hypothetical protein
LTRLENKIAYSGPIEPWGKMQMVGNVLRHSINPFPFEMGKETSLVLRR